MILTDIYVSQDSILNPFFEFLMQAICYGEFKENQQYLIEFKSQCSLLKSNVCILHNKIMLIFQLFHITLIIVLIFFRGLWTGIVLISRI